jgi:sentrin-specific protease 7
MMRKEDKQNSPVHIFSSHFYTTLSEEGHDAVQSWTAKKNVDVFSKNFLFIPVNKSLHWSLCVVVNPGDILRSSVSLVKSEKNDFDNPSPGSCILFLDSLQAHKKNDVAENVRKWLNAEWKRTREDEKPYPFDRVTMKLYTPKSKFSVL